MTDNNPGKIREHQLTEAQKVQQAENEANGTANTEQAQVSAAATNTAPKDAAPVQPSPNTIQQAPAATPKTSDNKGQNV